MIRFAHIPCYTDLVVKNLTLALDDELLLAARKVALDRDTSVNQLVREYLETLVDDAKQRQAALHTLTELFQTAMTTVGPVTWTRDEIYDRR